jgi:peptide deformylase
MNQVSNRFLSMHILRRSMARNGLIMKGCLSIPKIREDIVRNENVTLRFVDENFKPHVETYRGITARIVLHEYDHIEGKLFIDYLTPLKRKLMKGKLDDISKGKVNVDYKMVFLK